MALLLALVARLGAMGRGTAFSSTWSSQAVPEYRVSRRYNSESFMNAPSHMIRATATVALHGRESGAIKSTAGRWGARRKAASTSGVGALARDMPETPAILYDS